MDPITVLALTLGIGWASGINLYAAILTLGIMHAAGGIVLPPNLEILAEPLVVFAAGFLYFVQFVPAKVPGAGTGSGAFPTFVPLPPRPRLSRPPLSPAGPRP